MTKDFALTLTDIRLRQVARLLEWIIDHHPGSESLISALAAVNSARDSLDGRQRGAA